MPRKTRSDSSETASRAIQYAANGAPEPPEFIKLPERARPFWLAIMKTKAYSSWTPNDLVVAASLARINAEIERYHAMVEARTRLQKDEKGALEVSPIHKVLTDLQSQAASLCRTLQIHARATHGESRDQVNQNDVHRHALRLTEEVSSLIARPVH
jgi:hypothetical protein